MSVTNRRKAGRLPAAEPPAFTLISVCISAMSLSCATAKEPNCISKPMSRSAAEAMAEGTAPGPKSASTVSAMRRSAPSR